MTASTTFMRPVFSVVVFYLISLLALTTNAYALLSEPDHILYGVLPEVNSRISLQINGKVVTTYTRGENPAAGDYFILRVSLDSQDPPLPDTFRPNTRGELYLDAAIVPELAIVIGERGVAQRIFLAGTPVDTDLDGVEDHEDNCPDTANPGQDDANVDGQGDACDGNSDTDGDGYTDMQEYLNFHNGILDPDGYAFDPKVANAPRGEGYMELYPSGAMPSVLFLLLGGDK